MLEDGGRSVEGRRLEEGFVSAEGARRREEVKGMDEEIE